MFRIFLNIGARIGSGLRSAVNFLRRPRVQGAAIGAGTIAAGSYASEKGTEAVKEGKNGLLVIAVLVLSFTVLLNSAKK